MTKIIHVLFYLASLAAAILWWSSAAVAIPLPTWAGVGLHGNFMDALRRSANLNALAALSTGVSVFLSFLREAVARKG
jgi:hypothetical protein